MSTQTIWLRGPHYLISKDSLIALVVQRIGPKDLLTCVSIYRVSNMARFNFPSSYKWFALFMLHLPQPKIGTTSVCRRKKENKRCIYETMKTTPWDSFPSNLSRKEKSSSIVECCLALNTRYNLNPKICTNLDVNQFVWMKCL